MSKNNKKEFSPKKKDRIKKIRSVIELLVIIFFVVLIIRAIFTFKTYKPYSENSTTMAEDQKPGFISLSYFGVDRNQDETLISTARLDEHLKALYDSGYVTITQQDVYDYYKKGKVLPQKSLFLMFEDGRRDTAIFAEKIMEKYNFKATMMTYANKFSEADPKFLSFSDIEELKSSSFWEFGTNGYRLSYINVFDRWDNFLDCLDTKEFQMVQGYLDRNYDHYLMDFIRDENDVPKETLEQLEKRIGSDYEGMKTVYTDGMGEVPNLYVLMHSNTGRFGSSEKASAINEQWIYDTFKMNFNREGDCLNTTENSIYDLTRTQPQANWFTNHVLMRVWDDTKQEVAFVDGDKTEKAKWDTTEGETEFREDTIVLTSLPDTQGLTRLKSSDGYKDFSLHTTLQGNDCGGQAILIRSDDKLENYISVSIENEVIYVKEIKNKKEKELYSITLDDLNEVEPVSAEEDEQASRIAALQKDIKYANGISSAQDAAKELQKTEEENVKSVSEGAVEYDPPVSTLSVGDYDVDLTMNGNTLTLYVEDRLVVENLEVTKAEAGSLWLKAIVGKDAFSQRNLSDDVYDAVFDNLYVETLEDEKGDTEILYDNRLHGWDKFTDSVSNTWDSVLNWFIRNL